jgi:cytochrome c556
MAQNEQAIKNRQDLMDTIAKASSEVGKMVKGQTAFDLAKAQSGLHTSRPSCPR